MSDDPVVIDFRSAAPSARMKTFDIDDKRPHCPHKKIVVWRKEPILECDTCGSVVDPYYWIRQRCEDWKSAQDAVDWKVREANAELEELRAALKILRAEYGNETEKLRARQHLMIMPPRRRV